MIPESQKTHNDVIDMVIEASQKVVDEKGEDGTTRKVLQLDPETIYWKTQLVNSPFFARFVYELKEFESLAAQCVSNMTFQRARQMADDIIAKVASFRYSIDAKSSESLRNNNNTQQTLIDKINRNKIEKAYTVKGATKKSLMDGLLGREGQSEAEDDN